MTIEDTRLIDCGRCDGSGIEEGMPIPTPSGPYYPSRRCEACGGTGKIEIEDEPIEQEDLP